MAIVSDIAVSRAMPIPPEADMQGCLAGRPPRNKFETQNRPDYAALYALKKVFMFKKSVSFFVCGRRARSAVGYKPSTSITWFQANIACANAGKHLLTNSEWQAAAAGTPDPGAGVASPGCKVNSTPDAASAQTGERTACVSGYGVENMVGSVWEWVADWGQYGQISQGTYIAWADGTSTTTHWPDAGYGADGSWNVAGRSYNGAAWVNGLPVAVLRGGWADGADAGVFAFDANDGPSAWTGNLGFRCGRRR